MHTINTKDLRGNEILAKDVLSNSDIVLIYKGTVLKNEYKKRLLQLGIDTVVIEDQIQADQYFYLDEEKKDIIEFTNMLTKNLIEQHIYTNNGSIIELCEIAQNIISEIIFEEDIYEQIINVKQKSTDLYTHSINVCTLSTLIALKLNLDREFVNEIAKGAILHDIGFRYVKSIYEDINIEELSYDAKKEYKKHVIYGYEAVSKIEEIPLSVKRIILHHHENLDGSGFPFHLKEDRIPYEAKIVGACDAFDRKRVGIGSKKIKTHEIIEYLKIHRNIRYDSEIIDILLEMVAIYPIGTKVLTNENEVGIVVRQNKNFTERPVIIVIEDSEEKKVDPPIEIDLLKVLTIYIKDVLN